MKKCELCKVPARIFCDSDQASLCWDCDAKVHAANFLVARHVRQLLCRTCLSPTPWKASGVSLVNAASVCHRCAAGEQPEETQDGNDDDSDGHNQVVPWSSTPPPPASSSGSECSSSSSSSSSSFRCKNDNDDEDVSVSVSESETTTSSLKRQRDEDEPVSDCDLQGGESRRRCRMTEKRR